MGGGGGWTCMAKIRNVHRILIRKPEENRAPGMLKY
jgi:hypothetical protein